MNEWRDVMAAARLALAGRPMAAGERLRRGLGGSRDMAEATRAGAEWLRRAMPAPGAAAPPAASWAAPGRPATPSPAPDVTGAPKASAFKAPVFKPPASRAASSGVPGEGAFLERSYSGPAGSRPYRLYVPGGARSGPMPLVVMLHGCTQSPEDFAAGTRMNVLAEAAGVLVAYPAQTKAANCQKCWNWFSRADQARDGGEPAIVAGIVREVMAGFPVDPRRIFVAGLSAGGAAAAVLGQTHPDLFAAVGVHSGLPAGAASDVSSAMAAMRQGPSGRAAAPGGALLPTIVFHGDADSTVNPVNGARIAAAASGPGWREEVEAGSVPGGHPWTRTVHRTPDGAAVLEHWVVRGAGHAWSGGDRTGSYTDPRGPDASREMLRFFLEHPRAA